MEEIIARAAEAVIIKDGEKIIKRRVKKGYRIPELDEKLRKQRTRSEAKIISKLKDIIPVPSILNVDEEKKEITMQFIEGKKLSEWLDNLGKDERQSVCEEIGKNIALMHESKIIHGDLTTSNMIFREKVYFIDFGLGFHSSRIEDMAVDLHLLRQAFSSKHFENEKEYFDWVVKGYNPPLKDKVLSQLKAVESRGRYQKK